MARTLKGRAGITLADQAFSSASNFLVGLFVARLAGPREFGAFALAYAVWLAVAGLHRALITDPLLISTDSRDGEESVLGRGVAAELLLGLAAGAAVALIGWALSAAGASTLGGGLVFLAPWLTVLLAQDYWRWVAFNRGEPAKALLNDVVYTVVQVGVLLTAAQAGHRSAAVALGAWGIGAACGMALGLWQFRVRLAFSGGWRYLRQSWPVGRWLAADFGTAYGANQVYQFAVAAILGPVGIGAIRAALNLMGPTHVLLYAGGSLGLPESVKALERSGTRGLDRVVRLVSLAAAAGVGAYGLVVGILGGKLMAWIYGPAFAPFGSLVALAALQHVIAAVAWGPNLGLKAAKQTRSLFRVRIVTACVSITSVVLLANSLGIIGAAWGGVVTVAANVSATWFTYHRWRRREVPPHGGPRSHEGGRRRRPLILGVRVDPLDTPTAVARVEEYLENRGCHVIHQCNSHNLVLASKDERYRSVLNGGDLNLPDGWSTVWAGRLAGARIHERIAGADLFDAVVRRGLPGRVGHFFYGGTPETLDRLVVNVRGTYPGVEISGTYAPPFRPLSEAETDDVVERINRSRASVVWVGLGTPKQDFWMEAVRSRLDANVLVGVGAVFDFLSGAKKRAPVWMQRSGLEWLHRLISEPRRLWRRYVLGNPEFVIRFGGQWVRERIIGVDERERRAIP
jgi:N-acetylglucosaminyldiphosphoundecaprenol N-acetyl-beta-D-mannosaminyltransferase